MNHNWREHVFNCDGIHNGVRTCVQTFRCSHCEKEITLPFVQGLVPRIDGACIDTREEREKARERAEAIKARQPKGWGNGKKARGGGHGK